MTTRLPIKNVGSEKNIQLPLKLDPDGTENFEIYTGSVAVGYSEHNGQLSHEQFSVLIPIKDSTVRFYNSDVNQIAASVALGGSTGDDDETNTASVDSFFAATKPQSFPGIGGNPPCLVLFFTLGVMNGTIHRVSYNITLRSDIDPKSDTQDVGGNALPA
jgi:hypothetical protein